MQLPIRVYTPFIDLVMETDNYSSLQFERDFYGVGSFELHINKYMHGADAFKKGNIIVLDKQKHKAGIILTKEIALDQNGKETENWKITGYSLKGIITRRITVPPDNKSHDQISGDAETVMKHFIDKHFITPEDPERKMPQLEIAPNLHQGDYIEYESRYKKVSDELEAIGKRTGLGWMVYADTKNKKFIFDVLKSKDLRQNNTEGNSPVVFSPEFGTVKSQHFSDSDKEYKNSAYVGGQGEGEERKIVEIGDEEKGLDRIETFIDARDIGNSEGSEEELSEDEIEQQLIERGELKLSEMQNKLYLEAQILTPVTENINRIPNGQKIVRTPFEYEVDFDLGDRVSILNKSWGVKMAAPITKFLEVHEAGGFRLEATFGESLPTFITKIKNKFDELNGVEKQEIPAKFAKIQAQEAKEYSDGQLSKEQQERVKQAQENLEESKRYASEESKEAEQNAINYTEQYAEKKVIKSTIAPSDTEVLWLDISKHPYILKAHDGTIWRKATPTEAGELVYSDGTLVEDLKPNEAGADVTGKNRANDTENVDGRPSSTIEDKQGAQEKADQAERNANVYTDSRLTNYVEATVYDSDIADIQAQIDHQVQSHFYAHTPTLTNMPAIEWSDDDMRSRHVGDLFFNTDNGYSYRFAKKNGIYEWVLVRDEGIAKALEDAADAQDTADSKRRVFVAQPVTPYDAGDLWDNNGAVYRSTVTKTQSATFSSADWVKIGDVTSENTSNDTANVGGSNAGIVRDNANAGKSAKDKIDVDVGTGTIETTTGAQTKANQSQSAAEGYADTVSENAYLDAVADAEAYVDENGIMEGQEYNGVSISNADGFLAVRSDELVRSGLNATDGIFVQSRDDAADPWSDVFYVDENGNLKFAGDLEGASGTFSGTVSGAIIEGSSFQSNGGWGEMTIDDARMNFTGTKYTGFGDYENYTVETVFSGSEGVAGHVYNGIYDNWFGLTPKDGAYQESIGGTSYGGWKISKLGSDVNFDIAQQGVLNLNILDGRLDSLRSNIAEISLDTSDFKNDLKVKGKDVFSSANVDFNSSGEGYIEFPNGLIIQWFTFESPRRSYSPATYYTDTVSFPKPFPNACLTVQQTQVLGNDRGLWHNTTVESISSSSFNIVQAWGDSEKPESSIGYQILAIGF
ncbi:virus ReqiPepy6 Gp37-like protein [Salinibacillus kushneri]|uniref:Virus ReqiPepy6 Gp37-like protein n=1 Tax=Salinibacillus kushneri TaxID=237682 RepID=A0A1I0B7Z0_9BACI|nr:siphovirus ReqiPepy6 Gp37-like family protein [Salinibacillus kushneri]SET02624.1 virus ReqiPepy6 Gp37-like protein [Salinibacillus kushneri]